MNESNASNVVTAENIAFLIDGFGSIAYRFGMFFGVLILITLASELITGFSNFGLRSVVFLFVVYLVLIFLSILVIAILRVKAVCALKQNSEEEYLRFLKSDKKTKHEILGTLV